MNARDPTLFMLYTRSSSLKFGGTGCMTAPHLRQATYTMQNSAQMGIWNVTTSPGSIPSSISHAARRPARSSTSP